LAWKIETDSILIKEKSKHLTKMLDRVSKLFWSTSAKSLRSMKVFIEVYIDNQSVFVIVYFVITNVYSKHRRFYKNCQNWYHDDTGQTKNCQNCIVAIPS
jgi:hypothetical protein